MRAGEVLRARGATLLERLAAYAIDVLLTALLWIVVILFVIRGDLDALSADGNLQVVVGMLFIVVPFVYFVIAEGATGSTVGKHMMGLQVVGPHGDEMPGLFGATVRNVLRLAWELPPVGPVFVLIDIVLIQFTERDQRLGDAAAGTRVVRVRGPRARTPG